MFEAFLRSINVGGRNIIKMNDLSAELKNNGFSEVKTYIQSGNIIFNCLNNDISKISETIELLIKNRFNLKISVIVLKSDELKMIIENNPFINNETKHVFVTLCKSKINTKDLYNEIINEYGDCFVQKNGIFYIKCLIGYSNTKYNNTFFEKKFETISTTRNIETLIKVHEIALEIK